MMKFAVIAILVGSNPVGDEISIFNKNHERFDTLEQCMTELPRIGQEIIMKYSSNAWKLEDIRCGSVLE
jgi:hypothetical protein